MFSLIITIVSIALVAALALATLYYGGGAFTQGAADAKAAQLLNEGQQLMAAADLYRQRTGQFPDTMNQLLDGEFLKSVPVGWAMSPSFAQVAGADDWRLPARKVPLFIKQENEPQVCQSVNQKTYGIDGVLLDMRSELVAQCFGPKNTFTVAVTKGVTTFEDMPPTTTLPFTPSTDPIPDPSDTDAWEIAPGEVVTSPSPVPPVDPFEPPPATAGLLTVTPYYFPDGYSDPAWGSVATDRADREGTFTLTFVNGEYFYAAQHDDSSYDFFLVENRTEDPITLNTPQSGYVYGKYDGAPNDLGRGYPYCDLNAGQVLQPGAGCVIEVSPYNACIGDSLNPPQTESLSDLTVFNVEQTFVDCGTPDPEPGFLVIDPESLLNVGYMAPRSTGNQTVTLSNPDWTNSSVNVTNVDIDGSNVQYVSDTCPGWDVDPEGIDGERTPIVLTPGESCEMTFELTAAAGETASFDFGTVFFDYDNGDYTGTRSLIFRGSTIQPTPQDPTLQMSPTGEPFNVGFVGLGNGALVQNSIWVLVTNKGSNPLTITDLQLSPGPHGAVEIIDRVNCDGNPPYTLAQDQECAFRVAGVAPTDLQFPYTPNANFGTFRVISNTAGSPANETMIVGSTGNTLFMPSNPAVLQNSTEPSTTPRAYNKLAVGVPVYIDLRRYLGAYIVPPANESLVYQENRLDGGGVSPSDITWSFPSGSLPAGLTFDPATALITGTPTVAVTNQDLPFTATYNPFASTGSEGIGQVTGAFNLTVLPEPFVEMFVQSVATGSTPVIPDGAMVVQFSGPLMETWNQLSTTLNWTCSLNLFSARGPANGRYVIDRSFGDPVVTLDSPRPEQYANEVDPVFDPAIKGAYVGGVSYIAGSSPQNTFEGGTNFMGCTDGEVTMDTPVNFPSVTPVNARGVTFTPQPIPSGGSACYRFGPNAQFIGNC